MAGKKAQNRTYQDLLKNKNDEFNFEQLARSEIYKVPLKGKASPWLASGMYGDVSVSPAGDYVMVEEYKAPFADNDGAVSKSGLRLKSTRTQLTECPYYRAFQASEGAMSAADYAASLIPTMRSWSETVFLSALDARPRAEAQAIVDEFYQSYEDEVAQNPEGHAMDYIHVIMVIEKT